MPDSAETRFDEFDVRGYAAGMASAVRRVGPGAAEDVAAETFAIAWRRLGRVPADDPRPARGGPPARPLAIRRRDGGRLGRDQRPGRGAAAGERCAAGSRNRRQPCP
jgi:RNA polymerase sigma-70 factor (ECF subfamily)